VRVGELSFVVGKSLFGGFTVSFSLVEVAFDFVGALLQESGDGFVSNRT